MSTATMAQTCQDLTLDQGERPMKAGRGIVADDLLRLRDFGPAGHPNIPDKLFSVSPRKDRIALQLRRADPDRNDYCFGILVVPLSGASRPNVIDLGGEYLAPPSDGRGLVGVPSGVLLSDPPKWSSDGRWLAYLRKDSGKVRLWRASAEGGAKGPIGELSFDVEAFVWGEGDTTLLVSGRPGLGQARANLAAAGRHGYLFDDGFVPGEGSAPQLREPVPREVWVIDVATGAPRPATPVETAKLQPPTSPSWTGATRLSKAYKDHVASVEAVRPDELMSPTELRIARADGTGNTCKEDLCAGIADMWWRDDRRLVFLSRRAGDSRTRLVEWRPDVKPRLILETESVLFGCQLIGDRLICGYEASSMPRRLIAVDLNSGASVAVFDPNPAFQTIALGSVQRLRWTNDRGLSTYSDLILPRNHRPGEKHPLVIVQYITRGFLRGGTGDEYPMWLLAEQGFAVLSFQRPQDIGWVDGAKSPDEANRAGFVD
ncbi:MAG: hypothetical protein B7Z26_07750, partial [Asticcacaulis sp. 32-58-5]